MRHSIVRAFLWLSSAAIVLAACQSFTTVPSGGGLGSLFNGGVPVAIHFRRLHPSTAWRRYGRAKRLITFPTQIQHVVVIIMENRSVDDLFAGYYSRAWESGGTWGTALDLHNPAAEPTLLKNSLSAHFDPNHEHELGFQDEIDGTPAPMGCASASRCPAGATDYSYAPPYQVSIYAQLIEQWAFANNVLQANQGPSFPSHQYSIAGQSGGLGLSSPDSMAENPSAPSASPSSAASGNGNYSESLRDIDMLGSGGCDPATGFHVKTVNMSIPAPSPTGTALKLDNGKNLSPPCEEYNTILDEIYNQQGAPGIADWQYIAHAAASIWSAPIGVKHLYECWQSTPQNCAFMVDPDAIGFVQNLTSPGPSPTPFASLTYITPCSRDSDHPGTSQYDWGPEWAAWVINAIGTSKYWNSTAIVVTWDDWGGFYDHEPQASNNGLPFRPALNPYGNAADPYEWGFRVPMIVISPYVTKRGYISSEATSGFQWRSQSAILQFVEGIFGLSSLGTDDEQNGQTDGLVDMFQPPPSASPLPFATIATSFSPGPEGTCPTHDAPPPAVQRVRGRAHREAIIRR